MSTEQSATKLMPTYRRLPVTFSKGDGVWLYDSKGNKFLDGISGISVCNLGHCHPKVTAAIQKQAGELMHTSNLYNIDLQSQLAQELTSITGMASCFFSNSGAEANEAAIKLARLYGNQKGIETPSIIVMEGAFHGRTMATLSASSGRKIQAGFEPLVKGFVRAPFNDLEAIRTIAKNNPNIVAIFLEPVQGEGGINVPDADYLPGLREICDEQEWLLMLDEVQSGNGRTGKFFAHQHTSIKPDVLTTAKGLGNGMPIAVCLAAGPAAHIFQPGHHGSTYGGNPLACAAGLAVVNTLFDDNIIDHAAMIGELILNELAENFHGSDYIKDIRGKGLMIGIELKDPCGPLVNLALAKGLLINVTSDNVIRLLPPLIITKEEANQLVDLLTKLIKAYVGDDRKKPRKQ